MSNMSYCRFNNTSIDLDDCLDSIEDGEQTSAYEIKKAKYMFERMCEFLYENDVIGEYDLDGLFSELDGLNEDCEDEDE